MDFCTRYHRVAWSHQPDNVCLFTRLRCKQWSCEYCANANRKMWHAFLSGQLPIVCDNWWMLTLTAHSRMRSEQASYKNLQHGIDVIMKRIRRVWRGVNYVRVFEKHPTSDALHAHLLVSNLTPFVVPGCNKNLQRCFLGVLVRKGHKGTWAIRTWLKQTAQECKIGYQAEVEQCRNEFAVWYVTKYLSKANQQINVKGLRHVSTSRRVGSPSIEINHKWEVGNFLTGMDVSRDTQVSDLQSGKKIPGWKIIEMGVYPPESERVGAPTPDSLTKGL